jgi:hypothetical protein
MEKTFETIYGKVTLRTAMIDTDGTNLSEGIEIKVNGKLQAEVLGTYIHIDDMTQEEVESFVEEHVSEEEL